MVCFSKKLHFTILWTLIPEPQLGANLIKENKFSFFYIIELRLLISNGLFLKKLHFTILWTFIPNPQLGINFSTLSVCAVQGVIQLDFSCSFQSNSLIVEFILLEVGGG